MGGWRARVAGPVAQRRASRACGGRFRNVAGAAARNLGPLAGFIPSSGFARGATPRAIWSTKVRPAGRHRSRFAKRYGRSNAAVLVSAAAVQ